MFVVPIAKDKIRTVEGVNLTVIEFTPFKDNGPAVYASTDSGEIVAIYFFDIETINGTRVEYLKTQRIFRSFGSVKRSQPLPQAGDIVEISNDAISLSDDLEHLKVIDVRFEKKASGTQRGLIVKCEDDEFYRISQIIDIDPPTGTKVFDRVRFKKLYDDYLGAR
jgi:hypothetical protein